MQAKQQRIICNRCQFYYITWDAKFPYGCKAFNFKSKQMPAIDVLQSSGEHCMKMVKKVMGKKGVNHG